jgi:hypothetical protein
MYWGDLIDIIKHYNECIGKETWIPLPTYGDDSEIVSKCKGRVFLGVYSHRLHLILFFLEEIILPLLFDNQI